MSCQLRVGNMKDTQEEPNGAKTVLSELLILMPWFSERRDNLGMLQEV